MWKKNIKVLTPILENKLVYEKPVKKQSKEQLKFHLIIFRYSKIFDNFFFIFWVLTVNFK